MVLRHQVRILELKGTNSPIGPLSWRSSASSSIICHGGIVKSCGSTRPADHAATSSCLAMLSTNTPFRKVAPARTSATGAAPLT